MPRRGTIKNLERALRIAEEKFSGKSFRSVANALGISREVARYQFFAGIRYLIQNGLVDHPLYGKAVAYRDDLDSEYAAEQPPPEGAFIGDDYRYGLPGPAIEKLASQCAWLELGFFAWLVADWPEGRNADGEQWHARYPWRDIQGELAKIGMREHEALAICHELERFGLLSLVHSGDGVSACDLRA